MEIPFFLPTSRGDLAGLASIPDNGALREPAVVLMPGDAHARTRIGVLRDVGRRLAEDGHPSLRFDYPGAGLSPITEALPYVQLGPLVDEACSWFLAETGLAELATAGTCLGARGALMIAASNEAVTKAVIVGCPIRRRRPRGGRVRAGLAALEHVGPKVARHLTFGARTRDLGKGWYPGLVEEIVAASAHANIEFVYGEDDEFFADFNALKASGDLPGQVSRDLEVTVLEGSQLRGLTNVEHHRWVSEVLERSLGSSMDRAPDAE